MIKLQVINQKAMGRNTGLGAEKKRNVRSSTKRSAKGNTKSGMQELLDELRALKPYLMIVGGCILSLVAIVLLFVGYHAATSSSVFYLKEIDVGGTSHTSRDEVKAIVRRSVAKSGVWSADILNIKYEIEKIPWIRSAIVSRVLPDGVRVRVTERVPQAVVKLSKERVMLVDEEASILGPSTSEDKPAPFVLRGWDEAIADVAREDNRQRVEVYRTLASEWKILGIASHVREINLDDVSDVRALVAFDETELEIRLGDKDFGSRLKYAIHQAELQSNSQMWSCYKYIDVSQGVEKGDRIVFGPRCSDEELERITKSKPSDSINDDSAEPDDAAPKEADRGYTRKETKIELKPDRELNHIVNKKTGSNKIEANKSIERKKIETTNNKLKTEQKMNGGKNGKDKNAKQKEIRPRKI